MELPLSEMREGVVGVDGGTRLGNFTGKYHCREVCAVAKGR